MKKLIVIFSVLLFANSSFAADGKAKFKLMFMDETGQIALENAHVTVYEDGTKVLDETFKGHKAKFKMKSNHRYIIIVKKEGFQEKALCYDLTNGGTNDHFRFDYLVSFTNKNDCAPQFTYDKSSEYDFNFTVTDVPALKSEIKGS